MVFFRADDFPPTIVIPSKARNLLAPSNIDAAGNSRLLHGFALSE